MEWDGMDGSAENSRSLGRSLGRTLVGSWPRLQTRLVESRDQDWQQLDSILPFRLLVADPDIIFFFRFAPAQVQNTARCSSSLPPLVE